MDPEMDLKITRLAREKKISKGEVLRQVLEIGFENTDYKSVSDKYDILLDRMQKMSDDMAAHFEKISHEIKTVDSRLNHNIIRANLFLNELSKMLLPEIADYINLRNQVQARQSELLNRNAEGET
jgi:hypothetical protein